MVDQKAFAKMTYGLYLVSARSKDCVGGCIVNTLMQVTASPLQMTVAINKENYTARLIEQSGFFTAVALSQSATMELIGRFGFRSGKEIDKFEGLKTRSDENGIPYICEQAVSRYSCKVVNQVDLGTHILFVGELLSAELLDGHAPMNYTYYHSIKNGITPPKASVYQAAPVTGYRCKICGYLLDSETIPEDFVCPICGRGREELEKIVG